MAQTQRDKFIDISCSYKGKTMDSEEHREIIDMFNAHMPDGYRMSYTDYHCAAAVSAWAYMAGIGDLVPCSCNCGVMISKAKSMGIWKEDESVTPERGWILVYDWDDGANYAKTDNKNSPDHVGVVVSVKAGKITVMEGNKGSSRVYGFRELEVNGRYIRGYIAPKFDNGAKAKAVKKTEVIGYIKINKKYKVVPKCGMNVRSKPSVKGKRVNGIPYGKTFKATKRLGNWVYSSYYKGWVCIKEGSDVYLKVVK